MIRVVLSSSAAIAALLLLRAVFQNRISKRLQYGMTNWMLFLSLACPWCLFLPNIRWSLLSAAKPLTAAAQEGLAQPVFTLAPGSPEIAAALPAAASAPSLGDILLLFWIFGIAGMAVWFLIANLRFSRFLHKNRLPLYEEKRIYICEGLSSPCLFGLFRPAIYVTPEAAQDKDMLRHVIVHEETHIRMHDQIHTLLRALYRIVYFFNPIVCLAVRCAEIDSELACDEETIKTLGEHERIAYGETLLALAPLRRKRNPLLSAIPVSGGKKTMKQRISRIAVPGKTSIFALVLAILLLASACTAVLGGEAADANAAEAGPFSPIFTNELMLSETDFLKSTGLSETDYTRADTGRTICLTLSRPVPIGTQAYTAEVHFNHGFEGEPMLQFDYLLDSQTLDDGAIYDALQSAALEMTDFYGAPDSSALADTHLQDIRSAADFARDLRVTEAWPIPGDWAIPGVTGYDVICTAYLRYDPDLCRISLSYALEIDRNSVS